MSKNSKAYREGVMSTIPDDLPDGAWMAMMEERGLDPLEFAEEFCEICDKIGADRQRPDGKWIHHGCGLKKWNKQLRRAGLERKER